MIRPKKLKLKLLLDVVCDLVDSYRRRVIAARAVTVAVAVTATWLWHRDAAAVTVAVAIASSPPSRTKIFASLPPPGRRRPSHHSRRLRRHRRLCHRRCLRVFAASAGRLAPPSPSLLLLLSPRTATARAAAAVSKAEATPCTGGARVPARIDGCPVRMPCAVMNIKHPRNPNPVCSCIPIAIFLQ